MSARILASTIVVPFLHVLLEGFLSKYYGETTRNLASILEAANALGRCIVMLGRVIRGNRDENALPDVRDYEAAMRAKARMSVSAMQKCNDEKRGKRWGAMPQSLLAG